MRKQPHPISREDIDKILEYIKKDLEDYWRPRKKEYTATGKRIRQYLIAICLGFGSGMRISEIFGLTKKQNYDYTSKRDNQTTHKIIVSSIPPLSFENLEDKFIYLSKRKKGKSGRVPLPIKLFRKAGITREELKSLLPLKVSYRSCQKYFTEVGLKVLNKHTTFHQLRHGFVTHALESGLDIHEVQLLAGHSRIDTTGRYLHANPTKAINKYEEAF